MKPTPIVVNQDLPPVNNSNMTTHNSGSFNKQNSGDINNAAKLSAIDILDTAHCMPKRKSMFAK